MGRQEIIEQGILSRYDLSYYSYRQLQRDHIRFNQQYVSKFPNNFICRILINYMEYAQEFLSDSFEKEISERFEKETYYNEYYYNDRIAFTTDLTTKIYDFDFINDEKFKKRTAITYILEKFTLLNFSEREKIYFYPQYKKVNESIEKREILLLKGVNGKEYEVKPYDFTVDDNSFSYYLIGYSRLRGEDTDYEYHSIKLSRIMECRSKHREYSLSYQETKAAKEVYNKFGAAYVTKNLNGKTIEKTIIRLTEKGYRSLFLKIIAHQRPIPVSEPKEVIINGQSYYELEFDCSHQQIRNYFFSFGKEAEVISPVSLRERFYQEYMDAISSYHNKCD